MDGPPSVATIYGPMVIGVFLSTILYGITLIQIVIYFQRTNRDPAYIKYFVLYLLVAETVCAALFFVMIYEPLVLKSGKPEIQITSPFLLRTDGPITALIATPVQLFMAWRIKIISRSVLLSVAISILSLCSLAGGIWLGVSVAQKPNFQDFELFRAAPGTWLVTAAAADVLIAASLVYFLVKRKTTIVSTNHQIDRIIRLTVQTGTITAVAALTVAVVFLSSPHTTIFFIWDLCLSKLYSNSVLSSLNARQWGTNGSVGGPTSVLFVSNFDSESSTSTPRTPASGQTRTTISHLPHSRTGASDDIELGIPRPSLRSEFDVAKDVESPTHPGEVHVRLPPSGSGGNV
ncbi:hypothetical protein PM082_000363 [Marasmius tenuissimus]|nr:hypothetical protein PM082_000363 [Marasmius tenuissimus]